MTISAELTEFQEMQKRYDELNERLASGQIGSSDRHALQKEHSQLSTLLKKYNEIRDVEKNISDSRIQLEQTDDQELKQLFQEELTDLENKLVKEKAELENIMYPPDESNKASAYIEIRAGAGGQEAALFVGDLVRMYSNYALRKGWNSSIVDFSQTDLKGYKDFTLYIKGKGVYGLLKHESGVHRVQRVPLTETAGRVHTSTVTVAVFPEIEDEGMVEISNSDLRIDVFRAGGAGGQHVNKTESAVRITHMPSGIVVACQDDRSQHKNKEKALKVLKSRLAAFQKEKQELEMQTKRKEQVGRGMRAEKARTYNFPQNRITDHQAEITINRLDFIMEGDLDEIVDALVAKEKEDRKKYSSKN